MKKSFLLILILWVLIPINFVFAQSWILSDTTTAGTAVQNQSVTDSQKTLSQVSQTGKCTNGSICYTPLEPFSDFDAGEGGYNSFPYYLSTIFKILISFGALSAVVMLVWGGIAYIVSDAVDMKGNAKKRIQAALLGLALLAGSYLILNTINPDLLKFNLNVNNLGNTANQNSNIPVTSSSGSADTTTGRKTATTEQMARADSALGLSGFRLDPAGGDQYFLYDPKTYDEKANAGLKEYENYCENEGFFNTARQTLGKGSRFETKAVQGSVFDAPGKTAVVCIPKKIE